MPVTGNLQHWMPVLAAATLAGLAACGGGGGGGDDGEPEPAGWTTPPAPPAPPAPGATVTGVFRDANVQGLSYQSGVLTGATAANGQFQFASGSPVTFRVGGVTLGTAPGLEFMTPMHLTQLGSPAVNQIQNRNRFLQMLDADGNPDNGILISEAVRAVAVNWAPVDFTTTDLPAQLASIIAEASAADGTTHVLPSVAAADEHFARTFRCTMSGLFRGTFSGSGDNGVFAVAVFGGGQMRGIGFSNVDKEGFDLEQTGNLLLTIFPTFSAGFAGTGATFAGRFESPTWLRGNWTNGADTGSFEGARTTISSDPVYRFTGFQFPQGFPVMLLSFEIDASNAVRGAIIDTDAFGNGAPVTLTGTVSGTSVTASGGRFSLTGNLVDLGSPTSRRLTGTVRDSVRAREFNTTLAGCRLN